MASSRRDPSVLQYHTLATALRIYTLLGHSRGLVSRSLSSAPRYDRPSTFRPSSIFFFDVRLHPLSWIITSITSRVLYHDLQSHDLTRPFADCIMLTNLRVLLPIAISRSLNPAGAGQVICGPRQSSSALLLPTAQRRLPNLAFVQRRPSFPTLCGALLLPH